jgi:Holliday junction resolvase RusA-like endonuclease
MTPPRIFFVHGDPAAQGSKRLVRLRNGRTVMLEQSQKVKPWRSAIAARARESWSTPIVGDVEVAASVQFVRPASHYRKDGTIKPSAPARPGYADCDKLARAICDGLAGIAYANDRQVARLTVERVWAPPGEGPGAWLEIGPLGG